MAKQYSAPPPMKIDPNKTYIATIDTTAGTMVAELWPKIAPQTVNSFVVLSREGYYDGVIFHRVIEGFMIQGGDPLGTGKTSVLQAAQRLAVRRELPQREAFRVLRVRVLPGSCCRSRE